MYHTNNVQQGQNTAMPAAQRFKNLVASIVHDTFTALATLATIRLGYEDESEFVA